MGGPGDRGHESPEVELARSAIEAWITERRTLSRREMEREGELLKQKAAAFVCLKKEGNLRGCIGTFKPTRESLADEIANNAISAACRDPRFFPVSKDELQDLEISVDVLSDPEPIPDVSHLDPKTYGVIVESGGKIGLLLPDIEGVDSVEYQLEVARNKAGIRPGEPVKLYRFIVQRHE
jgi:AmmeMemoRadiSam system protein A